MEENNVNYVDGVESAEGLPENHGKKPSIQTQPFVADVSLIPKIDALPHTVFLLCGPTSSGKSQFAQDLMYVSEYLGQTYRRLSSDEYRQGLLDSSKLSVNSWGQSPNNPTLRYSKAMSAVSRQAFEQLMNDLNVFTSFPVNTEMVVVDTTGMSEVFRSQVKDIAYRNGYNLVLVTFEYKRASEYIPSGIGEDQKYIIQQSVSRFRMKTLPSITSRDFPNRLRIKSKNSFGWGNKETSNLVGLHGPDNELLTTWISNAVSEQAKQAAEIAFSCEQLNYPKVAKRSDAWEEPTKTGEYPTYAIIGDSHECVEELKELVEKIEQIPGVQIIHLGDYLDKGGQTAEMVEYMYTRLSTDIILTCNHGNYLAGRLRDKITPNPTLEQEHFTALAVLQENKELAAKFLTLFDSSIPYAVLCDYENAGSLPVYVTHSPCENKYLAKIHPNALKAQRNYRVIDRTVDTFEDLNWLFKEANYDHPLHIFGHVSHLITEDKALKYKNKVFLDTGAVYGGKLTAAIVKNGKLLHFLSVPAKRVRRQATLPVNLGFGPKTDRVFKLEDYELEPVDVRLLNQIVTNDIKFISGTMCPAPSLDGKLEPLEGAFQYFKKQGVTSLILEPKFMGSRCQMYLFEEGPAKTFATSRAGWKIRGVTGKTPEQYQEFLQSVWTQFKPLIEKYGDMILDGELLPWSALGRGLIDDTFTVYQELVTNELMILDEDEGFKAVMAAIPGFDLESKKNHIGRFTDVLSRYSAVCDPTFEAFTILKASRNIEEIPTEIHKWSEINSAQALVVDLEDEESVFEAHKFFEKLTVPLGMEGVVVKPLKYEVGNLPYMKVRSEEYLRLVYGYDYLEPKKYEKLVRTKQINGKAKLSLSEYDLGMKMLTADGDYKKELVVRMIGHMKQEKQLDPRL